MQTAALEHVNITVSDPKRTAAMLCRIFGWHIRWEGASMDKGYTVHVGTNTSYVALYGTKALETYTTATRKIHAGLNHIALVVADLDTVEKKVIAEGLNSHDHGEYQPGRRFYFHDNDGVEYEVVSYAKKKDAFKRNFMRQLGIMARFGALAR